MQTRTEGAAAQVPRQKRGIIGRFANMSALRRQQAYYAILFIFPGLAVYLIFVMTGGGPGHASEALATYTYKAAFVQNQAGYGSALAVLITVLSFVSAVVFVRLRERQR